MCGICGFIRFDGQVSAEDVITIQRMNGKLLHRGPDAQDVMVKDNIALGFSRLSIIGLDNGMQPIYNEDRSIILICNGEIFNYIELRRELISRGHSFSTQSDVEVIIHLYEESGMDFLNRMNGQFAFALYDTNTKCLYCARDQMGILPLYYTFVDKTFIFGSEIKAILQHPKAPREVDMVGLDQVFTFAGLISPRTLFKHVSSLGNGHFIRVDGNGEVRDKEYWDLIYPEAATAKDGHSEDYYIDKLESLFEASISLRLRADVPSGLYLSGGLDSSMIAMKISQMHPGARKEAFSIDFVESRLSESFYQQLVARESNVTLNQKIFFCDDISERLRHSIYHSECPIKETYNTASLSLSEAARSRGIKVIQSGEGGDELFAGYVGYRFDKMREMNLVQDHASPEEKRLRDQLWGDPSFFYEMNFLEYDKVKKGLYSSDVSSAFDEVNCLRHPILNRQRVIGRDILNKRSYIDYKIRLVDHLVSDHGDRMALANSVEARYPFLDKDLAEFSATIPPYLKLNDFNEKYILKRMAERFVPKPILEREKFHFTAPGSPYLLQKNVEYVYDLLSYDLIKKQGYFNPDWVEALKKTYQQNGFVINAPYETDHLIIVITFGILLDTFFN